MTLVLAYCDVWFLAWPIAPRLAGLNKDKVDAMIDGDLGYQDGDVKWQRRNLIKLCSKPVYGV